MAFQVGDKVLWRSQAAGVWRTKRGEVIEVVPPRRRPKSYPHIGGREEESYIVRATPERAGGKPQLYFPRSSALKRDE